AFVAGGDGIVRFEGDQVPRGVLRLLHGGELGEAALVRFPREAHARLLRERLEKSLFCRGFLCAGARHHGKPPRCRGMTGGESEYGKCGECGTSCVDWGAHVSWLLRVRSS